MTRLTFVSVHGGKRVWDFQNPLTYAVHRAAISCFRVAPYSVVRCSHCVLQLDHNLTTPVLLRVFSYGHQAILPSRETRRHTPLPALLHSGRFRRRKRTFPNPPSIPRSLPDTLKSYIIIANCGFNTLLLTHPSAHRRLAFGVDCRPTHSTTPRYSTTYLPPLTPTTALLAPSQTLPTTWSGNAPTRQTPSLPHPLSSGSASWPAHGARTKNASSLAPKQLR